jgi:adenylate kinase family enzyme
MNVLITGVSGSGKTSIATELAKRGYDTRNMDSIEGLCSWVNLDNGKPESDNRENDSNWLETHDWLWNEEKLKELLQETDDTFYCGSSGNQKQFYPLFGKVILLEMSADLIKERVLNNSRDHSYGQMPGEMDAIMGYFEEFQDEAKAAGAVIIDARKPLSKVVSLILAETGK